MDNFHFVKSQVSKIGGLENYINTPVIEKANDGGSYNAVGVVTDAVEYDNYYELSISLWKDMFSREYTDGKVSALVVQ